MPGASSSYHIKHFKLNNLVRSCFYWLCLSFTTLTATGATVSAVTLANPQIQKKTGIQKTTNGATTTAEPIVKHANTSAANTKQSGSADKTKASRLSTQKSETVTNKSKDDSKSSEKQKPKIKPKPKPPDRLTKAMKNPVSSTTNSRLWK